MVAGRAVVVVLHVVFARPQHLDGYAGDLTRNPRRFQHVVIREAPPEPAADPHDVDGDVGERHAEH